MIESIPSILRVVTTQVKVGVFRRLPYSTLREPSGSQLHNLPYGWSDRSRTMVILAEKLNEDEKALALKMILESSLEGLANIGESLNITELTVSRLKLTH